MYALYLSQKAVTGRLYKFGPDFALPLHQIDSKRQNLDVLCL